MARELLSGGYDVLASTSEKSVNTRTGGINGLLSGEGLIQMEASGRGTLL